MTRNEIAPTHISVFRKCFECLFIHIDHHSVGITHGNGTVHLKSPVGQRFFNIFHDISYFTANIVICREYMDRHSRCFFIVFSPTCGLHDAEDAPDGGADGG